MPAVLYCALAASSTVFVQQQGLSITMGILFGLTAAICWGIADFVVTRIARELGVAQAFFYVQIVGMGLIGLLLLASPALPAPTARMWMLVVGIGLFNMAGT